MNNPSGKKLNNFIKLLQKRQTSSNAVNNVKVKAGHSFTHRFKAQQEIINVQKSKIIQQQQLIDQLKLGNMYDAFNESIAQTKVNIQEIFKNCSVNVKYKLQSSALLGEIDKDFQFSIHSNKAPKIIKRNGKRALQRENRRQIIQERKRIIDASKKHAMEVELAKKRTQDEEERKRNIELMQERRKANLEFHRLTKAKREKYIKDCAKADIYYKKHQIRTTFQCLRKLIEIKHANIAKSEEFYKMTLKKRGFKYWKEFLVEIDYQKSFRAINLYNYKLKRAMFCSWVKLCNLRIQQLQVAEDFYFMQLETKIFSQWHRYTCIQYMSEIENTKKAERHYKNRILLQYFYQWKSLPAILTIERAKEEKKRKWREKVWEILPDYKPVLDSSFNFFLQY